MDRLAESLPPGGFREWMAYERLEPDPLETIINVLLLGFSALSVGAHVTPEMLDPRKQHEEERTVSPREQVAMLRHHF